MKASDIKIGLRVRVLTNDMNASDLLESVVARQSRAHITPLTNGEWQ